MQSINIADIETETKTASNVLQNKSRLAAIGNGQVPICAALAWEILNS
jgi:hypothetical protein